MFRIIIVSPAFDRRGKRKGGLFDAPLQGETVVMLWRSHQPLLAAARIMPGESAHPNGVVAIRQVGTDYDAMMPIGIAAAYTVENTQFDRYGRKADATAVAAACPFVLRPIRLRTPERPPNASGKVTPNEIHATNFRLAQCGEG